MKYVFVRNGDRTPSLYDDFTTMTNPDALPQIGYYHQVKPGLRLVRNRTGQGVPFAIAHFHTDPLLRTQHPSYVKPINLDVITTALARYDYVMCGVVSSASIVRDTEAIQMARYVSRDKDGGLVDVETGTKLEHNPMTTMSLLFGAVKFKGLPVYTLILNPDFLHATDGFDYYDAQRDTLWMLLTDRDGPIASQLFVPTFSSNVFSMGSFLVVNDSFTLSLTSSDLSILKREQPQHILEKTSWTVETNLVYNVNEGRFTIDAPLPTRRIGYFKIRFDGGTFFNEAQEHERPQFNYMVFNNDNF